MKRPDRKKVSAEWKKILTKHPEFAKSFLIQQAILMEASGLGFKLIDRSMGEVLDTGLPVLFEDYWVTRYKQLKLGKVKIGGIYGCLNELNRDPARCFGKEDIEGFFEDPMAGGQDLPPEPPIPPLK